MEMGRFQHYKGGVYDVIAVAKHSETHEPMVIYRDVTDASKVWARPVNMFNEEVMVDGQFVPRFKKLD